MDETIQVGWQTLNTATVDQAAINAYDLAYSGTWATGAQNPAVIPASARELPMEANSVRIRFLIANADTEDTGAMIWVWDANGAPMDAFTCVVVAGPTLVTTHPVSQATLTLHYYADTITAGQDNANVEIVGGTTNGIAELRFDLMGARTIY